MRTLLVFFCTMACISSACAKNSLEDIGAVLGKVVDSPHRYLVLLAYIPNITDGAAKPMAIYDAPVFDLRIQAVAWQTPIEALNEALARGKLLPSEDAGRWAAGVRIEDKTTSAIVFSAEISVPIHVISVNGQVYAATPELVEWFRLELLPAVKALNKGFVTRDF